ncbi:hypothetical protein GUJ93_ZPchr0014g47119 [Zizania palustris]|uniref:Uncharacterized protein n=1 Tax=Zizania palustris TaxID=103762 RepID=A0A8J5TEH8_ZIZPA|nr:hypothetical protein GUJ93_ZPchr0014g47119 [Zizania palustris]
MQGGVSRFQNVPVTRAVVLASVLLSVVFSAQRRVHTHGLSYQVSGVRALVSHEFHFPYSLKFALMLFNIPNKKHFMSIAEATAKGF